MYFLILIYFFHHDIVLLITICWYLDNLKSSWYRNRIKKGIAIFDIIQWVRRYVMDSGHIVLYSQYVYLKLAFTKARRNSLVA